MGDDTPEISLKWKRVSESRTPLGRLEWTRYDWGRMKKLVLVITVLILLWTALFGWDRWVNAHRIVAGPENETTLYQSYDPEQVIKRFRYEGEGHNGGDEKGAVQLIKSIRHSREFTPRFTMQADQERELLNALREDIMLRLRNSGMQVVATHDEADGAFTYRYVSGNSAGSISVQAPVHQVTVRRYPVPSGLDDTNLRIALEETWTRPASETQWWMAALD